MPAAQSKAAAMSRAPARARGRPFYVRGVSAAERSRSPARCRRLLQPTGAALAACVDCTSSTPRTGCGRSIWGRRTSPRPSGGFLLRHGADLREPLFAGTPAEGRNTSARSWCASGGGCPSRRSPACCGSTTTPCGGRPKRSPSSSACAWATWLMWARTVEHDVNLPEHRTSVRCRSGPSCRAGRMAPRAAPEGSAEHVQHSLWHLPGGEIWRCFNVYVPPSAGEAVSFLVARTCLIDAMRTPSVR